jgi:hypothetical protein
MRTVKKSLKNGKRYLKNSNGFGFSRPKPFFLCKKVPKKLRCTVKNTPKLSLLIFRFRVKILSNETEFRNNQMEASLKVSTKFGEKSDYRH